MLNVVLVEPEIPANTGNIGRTCVLTGARLHLVGPMGFELSDKAVQRAGLAYWESLDVRTYGSWDEFVAANDAVRRELYGERDDSRCRVSVTNETATTDGTACLTSDADKPQTPCAPDGHRSVHLLTKGGERIYCEATYQDGDWLIFGKESSGLDADLLAAHPDLCERIPMRGDDALANADSWHESFDADHPELDRDICGNFVDRRASRITSLNLSNAAAIVIYEALRQTGFKGIE